MFDVVLYNERYKAIIFQAPFIFRSKNRDMSDDLKSRFAPAAIGRDPSKK